MAWIKFYGYDFTVEAYVYCKVAMEHKRTKDEAETEAYLATDKLFDNMPEVTVEDVSVTGLKKERYFDIAEVKIGVKADVVAHNYEAAYRDAESAIRNVSLPVGVTIYEVDTYGFESDGERVVGER